MKLLFVTVLLIASVTACVGQDIISGTVVDERGAAIAGAEIGCGGRAAGTTNSEGRFAVVRCAGSRISVSAPGFRTLEVSPSSAPIVLEPSILSATVDVTRTDTRINETPASALSVGRRDLQTAGALTLDDRLRQVPGFTLFRRAGSSSANPTTQGVSLRGVGASGASRALVVVDGVPINDPFGGWVYWGRVPGESIEAVELIRGPASDLYGSSAIGGVISIVERGSQERPVADLDLALGNERSPFGSFYGAIRTKRVRSSVATEAYRTDGFIPTEPQARGPVDTAANVGRYSLRPRFEYRPAASFVAFASFGLYRERRRNGSPLQNNDTRIVDMTIGFDVTTRRAGTLSGRMYGLTEKYHQSFSAIAADRRTETLNRLQTVPSQAVGANLQWTRGFGPHVVFLGSDIRQVRGRSDEIAVSNGIATTRTSSGGRDTSLGIFAGGSMQWKKVTISAGLRQDRWWNTHGYSTTAPPNTGGTTTTFTDRSESRISPRLSALLRVSRHVSLSGVFAGAFRQPTLNELYRSFRVGNVLTLANATLTAERAETVEGAGIFNAFDERLYLRAGPFCTRMTDPVSNVTLTTTPSLITRRRQNLGATRSCGIEADMRLAPTREWSVSAGYLFVKSIVSSMPGNVGLVGLSLPQIAPRQFTVDVRYSPAKIGTFAAQFRASSSQFDDDLNMLRLAPYATLDIFASHDISGRARVYFAAENLTGERIESGRTPVLTLSRPRTARVGIRLRLGKD